MKQDEYGTFMNDPENYRFIIETLEEDSLILIAWTDEEGSQYDILFAMPPIGNVIGPVQGGIKNQDLFVSIMRKGAFAFEIGRTSHPGYYAEKLNMGGVNVTTEKLGELIDAVRMGWNHG